MSTARLVSLHAEPLRPHPDEPSQAHSSSVVATSSSLWWKELEESVK